MSTTAINKCHLVLLSKLYTYSHSSNLVHTLVNTQQSSLPLSSCGRLKIKLIDGHNAGEGYKKIVKYCQLALSTLTNGIKRRHFRGTVKVKMRSGTLRSGGANKTFMEESVEENLTYVPIIKYNVTSMQQNIYRSLMHFSNKCCGLMNFKYIFWHLLFCFMIFSMLTHLPHQTLFSLPILLGDCF